GDASARRVRRGVRHPVRAAYPRRRRAVLARAGDRRARGGPDPRLEAGRGAGGRQQRVRLGQRRAQALRPPMSDTGRDPRRTALTAADARTMARLRGYTLVAAAFHAAQGVAVLALANEFALPVTGSYLAGPPGTTPSDAVTLFEVPVAAAVAVFLLLAAVDHLAVATPWLFEIGRASCRESGEASVAAGAVRS